METFSVIGSDKNAGKTTMFNFICRKIYDTRANAPVCLTAVGINGEDMDAYEGRPKPRINVKPEMYFVTAGEHLASKTGCYDMAALFKGQGKSYVLGKSRLAFDMVLEGPNTGHELLALKMWLKKTCTIKTLLIDGSIDRQFLARPDISDAFYFALLVSGRDAQMRKARDFLYSLSLPVCSAEDARVIRNLCREDTRILAADSKGNLFYHGKEIPSLDEDFKTACLSQKNDPVTVYLKGALSGSLHDFLSPFKNMRIILDNFTLYQNISLKERTGKRFLPRLFLLHPVCAKKIFLKLENMHQKMSLPIPPGLAVHNLFREDPHAVGI